MINLGIVHFHSFAENSLKYSKVCDERKEQAKWNSNDITHNLFQLDPTFNFPFVLAIVCLMLLL